MRLTILGFNTPFPPPGGACPGYLIESRKTRLLLECGSGVLAELQKYQPYWCLNAILLSHLHGDHTSDIFVYRYAVHQAIAEGRRVGPLPVYAPAMPAEELARVGYQEFLQACAINPQEELCIGDLTLSFQLTSHSLPAYACRISDGQSTLAYTADTEPFPELAGFVREADLLLAEATYLAADVAAGGTGHLAAGAAAAIASEAGVKRLVLTHLRSWYDSADLLAEARPVFPAVELASQGLRLEF